MTPTNLKDLIARARELHQKYVDAENHLQHVSALEQLKTFSRDTLPLLCDALEGALKALDIAERELKMHKCCTLCAPCTGCEAHFVLGPNGLA